GDPNDGWKWGWMFSYHQFSLTGSFCNRLDAQKNLAAVHPEQHQPEREQDGRAMQKRFIGCSEYREDALAEMSGEALGGETLKQMSHAIGRDGVHADDNQWKCPAIEPDDINHQIKPTQ